MTLRTSRSFVFSYAMSVGLSLTSSFYFDSIIDIIFFDSDYFDSIFYLKYYYNLMFPLRQGLKYIFFYKKQGKNDLKYQMSDWTLEQWREKEFGKLKKFNQYKNNHFICLFYHNLYIDSNTYGTCRKRN